MLHATEAPFLPARQPAHQHFQRTQQCCQVRSWFQLVWYISQHHPQNPHSVGARTLRETALCWQGQLSGALPTSAWDTSGSSSGWKHSLGITFRCCWVLWLQALVSQKVPSGWQKARERGQVSCPSVFEKPVLCQVIIPCHSWELSSGAPVLLWTSVSVTFAIVATKYQKRNNRRKKGLFGYGSRDIVLYGSGGKWGSWPHGLHSQAAHTERQTLILCFPFYSAQDPRQPIG